MPKIEKKQNFIYGAAILTVGVIIMKVLGAIYKIPLGNILGDYGYGIFYATYNVYNIFFTLSTAGLPVALSRLIAEADANGRVKQEEKTFKTAIITFAFIGVIFSSVMFFGSDWLAANYLSKPKASLSIKAMSPAILLVCLVSAYRGYCQGNGNMLPTTVDEVLEVFFKVVSGLAISLIVLKLTQDLAKASAGAIFGVTIGGMVSLTYMIIYRRKNYGTLSAAYTGGIDPNDTPDDDDLVDPAWKIALNILKISIPIALGSSVMAILTSLDPGICARRLAAAGFDEYNADVLYGVYSKAITLFNLPAALTQPLTISCVPAIAGALALGIKEESTKVSEDSLRITAVISMPMAVGLATMAYPIMKIMYPSANDAGPALLRIMAVASFFVCIVLIENAILQASGKERLPMYSMISGSLIKILVNWVLIATPSINIVGAPVGTLVGYIWMAVFNYIFIRKTVKIKPRVSKIVGGPLLCSAIMGISALVVYYGASHVIGSDSWIKMVLCLGSAIVVAVIVYLVSVSVFKTITNDDMKMIPGGEKVGKLLHLK